MRSVLTKIPSLRQYAFWHYTRELMTRKILSGMTIFAPVGPIHHRRHAKPPGRGLSGFLRIISHLAERRFHTVGQNARKRVGRASGGVWHDDGDRTRRICLRRCARDACCEDSERDCTKFFHVTPRRRNRGVVMAVQISASQIQAQTKLGRYGFARYPTRRVQSRI